MARIASTPPATSAAPAVQPKAPAPTAAIPSAPAPERRSADGFRSATPDRGWLGGDGARSASAATLGGEGSKPAVSPFSLVPGRYPDAVGLDALLESAATTPEGQAAVDQLLSGFQQKTGVVISQEVRTQVLEGAISLSSVLAITPQQMSEGIGTLNAVQRLKPDAQAAAPAKPLLPQHFDLAQLNAVPFERPVPALKQLAPGVFTGDLPSATPDEALKQNTVTAEAFDRLAANPGLPAEQQFSVAFGGERYTRIDTLLGAMRAAGYQVQVTFEQRIANFADLKTVKPGSNPPVYQDVPAPLLVRTGVRDAQGNEAVVPACHSAMHVRIDSGPNTKGPPLHAEVEFYQGTGGTGFFPAGGVATPAWCGGESSQALTGDAAVHAAQLAGQLTQVITAAATQDHLMAGGYGLTGVCNDSVAVVEQAVTGKITEYPLLMRDSLVLGEIGRALGTAAPADAAGLRELAASVQQVPNDLTANPSQVQRALDSMPWKSGDEPFQSTVAAREILQAAQGAAPARAG